MLKKGFTLVEIILSISLILIIGSISVVFYKKSDNDLEKVTKDILEAANAYIKIEKDYNGEIYVNKILNSAKGVKIPLSNLANSGYITEHQTKVIYDNNEELENNQDYYIIFVEDTDDYCDNGSYISLASWMYKDENIYLCDEASPPPPPPEQSNYEHLLSFYGGEGAIEENSEITEGDDYTFTDITLTPLEWEDGYYDGCHTYDDVPEGFLLNYINNKNGLYSRTEKTEKVYYYRGNINNNYITYKDKDFRILSFTNKKIRVIAIGKLNSGDITCKENDARYPLLTEVQNYEKDFSYNKIDRDRYGYIGYDESSVRPITTDFNDYTTDAMSSGIYPNKIYYVYPNVIDVIYAGIPPYIHFFMPAYYNNSARYVSNDVINAVNSCWLNELGFIRLSSSVSANKEYDSVKKEYLYKLTDNLVIMNANYDSWKISEHDLFQNGATFGFFGTILMYHDNFDDIFDFDATIKYVYEFNIDNIKLEGSGTKTDPFKITDYCD